MNYVDVLLTATSRYEGRAQRSALRRHRHISKRPLGLLFWQLGAEPFTAAAVAWGFGPSQRRIAVPGEPRDRELAFRALIEVAHDFNGWIERDRDRLHQIILPNRGNLSLLGRLGRRLAYLSTDGPKAADPELVRFGRHLKFIADCSRFPGQQVVLVLTELLSTHWVSILSDVEAQSLPALDAVIDPGGRPSHEAAAIAEQLEIGPAPSDKDDERLDPLLTAFNAARKRSTDECVIAPLRIPIMKHYERLIDRGWGLMWKCLERERTFQEAAHVKRRVNEDIAALQRHLEWVVDKGLPYRTRQTHEQAARTLRNWEDAQELLSAEEALDDCLRMVPYFLSNEAVIGRVVSVDSDHKVKRNVKLVRRPLVAIEIAERCMIPIGKGLYWTSAPEKREYVVVDVKYDAAANKSLVTLEHQTGSDVPRPKCGENVTFSVHTLQGSPPLFLPKRVPWTHRGVEASTSDIEEPEGGTGWE